MPKPRSGAHGRTQLVRHRMRSSQFVFYAVGKLVPGLVVMGSIPIWVRNFGAQAYGSYAVGWAVALAASVLATGWLRQAVLRFAGSDAGTSLAQMPRSVLAGSILSAGLAFVPAYLLLPALMPSERVVLAGLSALLAMSMASYGMLQTAWQRDGRALTYNVYEIARVSLALLLSLAVSKAGVSGADSIMLGSIAASVALTVTSLRLDARRGVRPNGYASIPGLATRAWRFGWPMSVWLTLAAATQYTDRLILSAHGAHVSLGGYAAASDLIVRGIGMLAVPVIMVIHPEVMRHANMGEEEKAEHLLRTSTKVLALTLAVAVMGTATLGPWVMGLATSGHAVDRLTMVFLAVGASLWQLGMIAHKRLEMADRTRQVLASAVGAWLAQLLFSSILVGRFGVHAVSLGLAIGSVIYLVLVRVQSNQVRRTGMVATR